jgi:long-subunit acyl-CoA synthetase (AMP-forming)
MAATPETHPCPQGVSSTTFTPPPIDGSLSIPEIYDHHLEKSPNHPLFIYDTPEGNKTVSWAEAGRAVHTSARIIKPLVEETGQSLDTPIAVLAVADQLTYFATTGGILRAGLTPFPISPRNSDLGVANLLEKEGVQIMFVSKDQTMQKLAAAAIKHLPESAKDNLKLLPMPSYEDLYSTSAETFEPLPPMKKPDPSSIAIILHSSGSTSFPKPIRMTHRTILQSACLPYWGEVDVCGKILSSHSLPFFHAMGVLCHQWATTSGYTLSNFAPADPPTVSTPDSVYHSVTTCGSQVIFCVPAFLESWSQDPVRLSALQRLEAVLFGGAPIRKAVGDFLFQKGVHLYPFYGATEIGGCCVYLQKQPPPEGWEYFKVSKHCSPEFIPYDNDIVQIAFKACETHNPSSKNIKFGEVEGFDTNDLLIRHPEKPELWKVHGRADDQIMHSTGEKTNPVPMENIINKDPRVGHAVMFGRGKFEAGVLIQPKPEYSFDPSDEKQVEAFREEIWPSVEEANKFGPSHSRIFKEIILVASPTKPFQFTPKGTPRRHIILNDYNKEIEDGYIRMQESSLSSIPVPDKWDKKTCQVFAKDVIRKGMGSDSIQEEDDIFQNGCDSLKASWIRNAIINTLKVHTKVETLLLPENFVYMYPTIKKLGKYLTKLTKEAV